MNTRPTLFCAFILLMAASCVSAQPRNRYQYRSSVPLVDAAHYGHSEQVRTLIAKGARINQKDKGGRTALMEAASINDVATIKLLLQKGAQVNLKDNGGSTALALAAASGNVDSVRLLLQYGADVEGGERTPYPHDTPLLAAIDNHIQIAKGFPNAGLPVELFDTVQLLIAHGANVNVKGNRGKTALTIAREKHFQKTVHLLEKAGAKH